MDSGDELILDGSDPPIVTDVSKALKMNITSGSGPYKIIYSGSQIFSNPEPNLINISGAIVDISGLKFRNITGQVFNINDSSVSLTGITIQDGTISDSNNSSLIKHRVSLLQLILQLQSIF